MTGGGVRGGGGTLRSATPAPGEIVAIKSEGLNTPSANRHTHIQSASPSQSSSVIHPEPI